MEDNRECNNHVELKGTIAGEFEFSHEAYGEKFYASTVEVDRLSGTTDFVPIIMSERLADVKQIWNGRFVNISGQFRSHNCQGKLILSVFAREFDTLDDEAEQKDKDYIFLDGYICKPPVYRETPLGREISEILLAVNRPYGKSDYIPCIAWGRNARFVSGLSVGEKLRICGRIQSREYNKKISDDEIEKRIAYEISISKMSIDETEEDK